GQGSQNLNMGRMLVERFPWAGDMADQAGQWLGEKGLDLIYRPLDRAVSPEEVDTWFDLLSQTENAQPAICFASVLWNRFLQKLGVNPVAVGGHSLGELTAFHAAGAFDVPDLIRLAAIRGRAMALPGDQAGAMVSLQCSRNQAESILKKVAGYIVLANINGPNQIILSGERAAVENAIQVAVDKGIKTYRLKVSNAFHSRLAAGAAEVLAVEKTLDKTLSELKIKLFSSVSGQEIRPGLLLNNHFANQVLAQVDFAGMITSMAEVCDLFLEVGPGRALTGLTNKITGKDGPVCLPVESKPLHDRDLNIVLGELFIRKVDIHWETIYGKRLIRPFTRPREKLFIKSSCEQPFEGLVEVPLPL
ncbi:MAG: acyltransferase domain-containing protein, partial [Desulfobulbaceae bacterium]|nr:acyltransferase domain-containing protein [Desulfobulbaceae bacterium]